MDIEIDEPYEGINDIKKRKAIHYQLADINRNNSFKNRGWIVIRFAEIQIHKEPLSCIRFIADVIKSINPNYKSPKYLENTPLINTVKQWSKDLAEQWSIDKYREEYLGISDFGFVQNDFSQIDMNDTKDDKKIEEEVHDDKFVSKNKTFIPISKIEKINLSITSNKYLSLTMKDYKTIVKPIKITKKELVAFCYIKNKEKTFLICEILEIHLKSNYYTIKLESPFLKIEKIRTIVNTAIAYKKNIRIIYAKPQRRTLNLDDNENIFYRRRSEKIIKSEIRTISNIQLSVNVLSQKDINYYNLNKNHITAYCNMREAQRNFRIDRITKIEILDI